MQGKFFVWSAGPNGQIPRFQHDTAESAKVEAERLARLNPGTEFHILHSVAFCVKQEVKWEAMPDVVQDMLPL